MRSITIIAAMIALVGIASCSYGGGGGGNCPNLDGEYLGEYDFGGPESYQLDFAADRCGTELSGTLEFSDAVDTYYAYLTGTCSGGTITGNFATADNSLTGTISGTVSTNGSQASGSWENNFDKSGSWYVYHIPGTTSVHPCEE